MAVVVFTAPCPECGQPATWHQTTGSGYMVAPADFTIRCRPCAEPVGEKAA